MIHWSRYLPLRHWKNNELIGQAYSQRFASAEQVSALAETPERLSEVSAVSALPLLLIALSSIQ